MGEEGPSPGHPLVKLKSVISDSEAHYPILLVLMVCFWNPFGVPLYYTHAHVLCWNFVRFPFLQTALPMFLSTTQSLEAAPSDTARIKWWDFSWAFKLNNCSLLSLSSNNNLSIIFIISCWICSNMSMYAQNWTQHSTHDLACVKQREGSTPLACWHHSTSCRPVHPE